MGPGSVEIAQRLDNLCGISGRFTAEAGVVKIKLFANLIAHPVQDRRQLTECLYRFTTQRADHRQVVTGIGVGYRMIWAVAAERLIEQDLGVAGSDNGALVGLLK